MKILARPEKYNLPYEERMKFIADRAKQIMGLQHRIFEGWKLL